MHGDEEASRSFGRARGFAAAPAPSFAALALFGAFALSSLLATDPAHAVPSFARQTGQPCASCHTAFPELTPFGRRFKLAGYTLQGGDCEVAADRGDGACRASPTPRSAQDPPPVSRRD